MRSSCHITARAGKRFALKNAARIRIFAPLPMRIGAAKTNANRAKSA